MAKLSDDETAEILHALGTIQGAVIVMTGGGDKEIAECDELSRSVVGNKSSIAAVTSEDMRQFIEATIRWCGGKLGMQVEYPYRRRTWLDGEENDGAGSL